MLLQYPFPTSWISIHAPVKGATGKRRYFYGRTIKISIHAPVKGATAIRITADCPYRHFNPRTREGCDRFPASSYSARAVFQSTHP